MLIDTDVLIWMTRGHAGAASRLQTIQAWRISAVTPYQCGLRRLYPNPVTFCGAGLRYRTSASWPVTNYF